MIILEENRSTKLPCYTSIYFKLSFFDRQLFDTIVQTPDCLYNNKTGVFECTVNRLYFLVNTLTKYDDVKVISYKESKHPEVLCDLQNFKVKPYAFQLDGINYGINHKNWLLLDDQGLGKTFQIINLCEYLRIHENLEHVLIVCGVNSLKFNWVNEIGKYSNLSSRILGQVYNKSGRVKYLSVEDRLKELSSKLEEFFIITNIETLQSTEFAKAYNKSKTNFGMIVFDECHKCKNPTSKSARTLLKLKADRKVALTGTVIINKPEDAFVPLKWTENTSSTYSQFRHVYNEFGGFGGVQVVGQRNLNLLTELLNTCSLRRLKDEVLDLPDRVFYTEYVEMNSAQRSLYDNVSNEIATDLDLLSKPQTVLQELSSHIRLRQVTAFPGIVSTKTNESAKLDRLEDLVENIVAQGDKVVVMNSFKGAVYEEQRRLSQYNPVICTGDQLQDEINLNKEIFQNNEDCKVLIGTWQKMGTGHTLTAANYMIFVDTPFTDSDFKQAADRIYRIGQKKRVFIITLITKDTYDERVQQIIENKEVLSSTILEEA